MNTRKAMLAVLEEHANFRSTADWNGSPDPTNWRNILVACRCRHPIADASASGPEAKVAHRAHLADMLERIVKVEIKQSLDAPAECQVWINDVLKFAGRDFSADLHRPPHGTAAPIGCGSRYDAGGRIEPVACALVPRHTGPHYSSNPDQPEVFWRWTDAEAVTERTCIGCGQPLRLDRGLWTCDTDRCDGNLERLTRVYGPKP